MERKLGVKMGKESGLREEQFFIFYFLYIGFYDYRGLKKKKSEFLYFFFFLNDANVENCGVSRGFGYIIYIYI